MSARKKPLADQINRIAAITAHERSLLVEAGAGTGKTAVMAGRIAMMLAEGIRPNSIAAVTFTEFAASELFERVRNFVEELLAGRVPTELRAILPSGLDERQVAQLNAANAELDDLTCSTIHGFCQRLIKPYPVEASIDPGAAVMDQGEADRLFQELLDAWLRERLSGIDGALISEMVSFDPAQTIRLIRQIAACLRKGRDITTRSAKPVDLAVLVFQETVASFRRFFDGVAIQEPETLDIIIAFEGMVRAIGSSHTADDAASLVRQVTVTADARLCTRSGGFKSYRRKGKWVAAAKSTGYSKTEGERFNNEAALHHAACCAGWEAMQMKAADCILADLVAEMRSLIERFHDEKRRTARLDFDDLIFAARELLRNHEPVRKALAKRYAHVLVDEFQDTDPAQTEIFWRLSGEPPADGNTEDWTRFGIRPGALFLVGDPKQAIYRFRGADVNAYLRAREAIRAEAPGNIISISTNFRSCKSILSYVNARFLNVLSSQGQPGFTSLDAFHDNSGDGPWVAALDIAVPIDGGKSSAALLRDCEAEAVADLCYRLIGRRSVLDRRTGVARECRAGDIALLAPTGSELWRYEEALEKYGIPVSTQAGKGLYRRQEIQDLIALTRVLADPRDTLAFGALLRGPLVGLSEEELLDIVWALPRSADMPDRLPLLSRMINHEDVRHELARDVISRLQSLARRANSTTPHDLLSQAVDVLRVRPVLTQRYRGRAERALANVDLYLDLARPYGVRGLRAFAEAMTAAWSDETRAIEGRPDAQEESISLYTMHAAKGLEWPIVIPINTMTRVIEPETAVVDREGGHLYCPVFGVKASGYEDARNAEKAELDRERIRLWYVATTRAREMLVLPRLSVQAPAKAWISLLDLAIADLPAIELTTVPRSSATAAARHVNAQTRETFAAEAAAIAARTVRLKWEAPSRAEDRTDPLLVSEVPAVLSPVEGTEIDGDDMPRTIQGGRERGLVIHKLFEEVLTGEMTDELVALTRRARELLESLGRQPVTDYSQGLSPVEIAGCVERGLRMPQIAAVRDRLVPEYPVYASSTSESVEAIITGVADAVAIGDGCLDLVVDWKSDVSPASETLEHYRNQVRQYLAAAGIPRGLIVLVTTGALIEIVRS